MADRESLVLGELLAAEAGDEPVRPSERLRQRVLGMTQQARRFEGFAERLAACMGCSTEAARVVLAKIDDDDAWSKSKVPGQRVMRLQGDGAQSADALVLVAIQPGFTVPMHRHSSDELAFCIQGGAEVRPGLVIEPGDFAITPAGVLHSCHSVRHETCIMLLRRRGAY